MASESSYFDTQSPQPNSGEEVPSDAGSQPGEESRPEVATHPKEAPPTQMRIPAWLKRPWVAIGGGSVVFILVAALVIFTEDDAPRRRTTAYPPPMTQTSPASRSQPPEPAVTASSDPLNDLSSGTVVTPASGVGSASPSQGMLASASAVESLATRVTALETSSARVESSVHELSSSVSTMTTALSSAKDIGSGSTVEARKRRVDTVKHSRPKEASEAVVRSLDGQTYAVVYVDRGIAWIQAGEHIDVVQPGARIGKVRVLSIDPVGRQVTTTDGVIR